MGLSQTQRSEVEHHTYILNGEGRALVVAGGMLLCVVCARVSVSQIVRHTEMVPVRSHVVRATNFAHDSNRFPEPVVLLCADQSSFQKDFQVFHSIKV
jgi:hypothetical protein